MNKRGAELTIGTLVVIVLAIIVLVVLALGFGTGWSNLWSKISGMFSPVNVDAVKQACVYACTTQAKYDYCNRTREVTYLNTASNKKDKVKLSCYSWSQGKNITWANLPTELTAFKKDLACDQIDC